MREGEGDQPAAKTLQYLFPGYVSEQIAAGANVLFEIEKILNKNTWIFDSMKGSPQVQLSFLLLLPGSIPSLGLPSGDASTENQGEIF